MIIRKNVMISQEGAVMETLKTIMEMDFTDPITLIPLFMLIAIALYFIAIFFDQPPQ